MQNSNFQNSFLSCNFLERRIVFEQQAGAAKEITLPSQELARLKAEKGILDVADIDAEANKTEKRIIEMVREIETRLIAVEIPEEKKRGIFREAETADFRVDTIVKEAKGDYEYLMTDLKQALDRIADQVLKTAPAKTPAPASEAAAPVVGSAASVQAGPEKVEEAKSADALAAEPVGPGADKAAPAAVAEKDKVAPATAEESKKAAPSVPEKKESVSASPEYKRLFSEGLTKPEQVVKGAEQQSIGKKLVVALEKAGVKADSSKPWEALQEYAKKDPKKAQKLLKQVLGDKKELYVSTLDRGNVGRLILREANGTDTKHLRFVQAQEGAATQPALSLVLDKDGQPQIKVDAAGNMLVLVKGATVNLANKPQGSKEGYVSVFYLDTEMQHRVGGGSNKPSAPKPGDAAAGRRIYEANKPVFGEPEDQSPEALDELHRGIKQWSDRELNTTVAEAERMRTANPTAYNGEVSDSVRRVEDMTGRYGKGNTTHEIAPIDVEGRQMAGQEVHRVMSVEGLYADIDVRFHTLDAFNTSIGRREEGFFIQVSDPSKPKAEAVKFLVRAGEFKALVDQKYGNAWISAEGQHRPEDLAELVQEYLKRNSTHVREELLAHNFMAVEAGTEKGKGSKRLGQKEKRYENIISDLMANKDPELIKQIIGDEVEVRREDIRLRDNGVSFTLDWEGLAGKGGGYDAAVTLERTAFGEVTMSVKTHGANINAEDYQQYAKEVDALSVSDKSQLLKYRKILAQGKNMTASNITDDFGARLSQIRKNHQAWVKLERAIGYKETENQG